MNDLERIAEAARGSMARPSAHIYFTPTFQPRRYSPFAWGFGVFWGCLCAGLLLFVALIVVGVVTRAATQPGRSDPGIERLIRQQRQTVYFDER